MARIVLGVGGGIAAYKACELLRLLSESGHHVRVTPTAAALEFVGAVTWSALSGQPATASVFDDAQGVPHVRLGQEADLVVVAPATANLLAKAAYGIADDLLTNVLLTARCPVLFAPAMHTEMWEHAATQQNVLTLRERGLIVLEPAIGRLTGVDSGKGRLPEPSELAAACERLLVRGNVAPDLVGRRIVVSAGGTREALDPVRYLGNRSSGRQGYALAATAAERGAQVTVVSANVDLPDPAGVDVVRVETAQEMATAVQEAAEAADVVVMAAAVADYRPAEVADHKIKKTDAESLTLELTRNVDILTGLVASRRPGQLVVGFAAETGDASSTWLEQGRAKLAAKGCDLLVVNDVSGGQAFGSRDNAAVVLSADGDEVTVDRGPKHTVADAVWDQAVKRLNQPPTP